MESSLKYIGPKGPSSARVMWIGEIPGKTEIESGVVHSGPSSYEDERMMEEAGLSPHSIFFTNVFRSYPEDGKVENFITFRPKVAEKLGFVPRKNAFLHPAVASHLDHLENEIAAVRPNIMILAGNVALWAVLGEWGISDWRGSLMADPTFGIKCVPTFNPAYLFQSWEQRPIIVWDYKKVRREADSGAIPERETSFIIRPSFGEAISYIDSLIASCDSAPTEYAADLETRGTPQQQDCIGIARSPIDAICIPFFSPEYPHGHYSFEEEVSILWRLYSLFSHSNSRPIWHNAHYDLSYIAKNWGFLVPNSWDTMIQWHTLFTGLEKSLSFVSSIVLPYHKYWKDEGKTWDVQHIEERWRYCCKDVCATIEIKQALDKLADAMGLTEQVKEEIENIPPFFDMSLLGVRQTREARKAAGEELRPQIKERLNTLEYIFGHKVNVRSTTQMRALFYDDLGVPPVKNRKTGQPTLAGDALERIAEKEPLLRYPIMLIEQIRSLGVYDSTFIKARLDSDERLRCSYNIAGTDTLRLSSSKTPFGSGANLQNNPKGSQVKIAKLVKQHGKLALDEIASALDMSLEKVENEVDSLLDKAVLSRAGQTEDGLDVVSALFVLPNIRSFFLADEGKVWVEADLERADVQVVVWESDDDELKDILRTGADLHTANAEAMGLKGDSTHSARDLAKKGVHAVNYGVKARTLASHLKITVAQAEDFIRRWFSAHPKIKAWHEGVEKRLKEPHLENRFVESAFGFRRYYFDRPEQAFTKALAWVPQHTVAITINRGIRNLYNSDLPLQLLLQVHDSVCLQYEKNLHPSLLTDIRPHLLVKIPYKDSLIIPISLAYSPTDWGSVEPVFVESYGEEKTR